MLSAIVMNWWQKDSFSQIFFGKWRIFAEKKFCELHQQLGHYWMKKEGRVMDEEGVKSNG
jgi:hypothetical protein